MAKTLLICSLVVGVVFLAIFFIISIASLEFNDVGLNYSSYFKSIENSTYTEGFHFLGLGHNFISYTMNLNTVLFSDATSNTLP
jgi:hypothetical protein